MAEVKDGLPSTDFSRMNREYVKAVAENAAGGGGGLPDISESDEGKVLTAENGEAAWSAPDSPIIRITATEDVSTITLNSTWQEIHDMLAEGKILIVTFFSSEGTVSNHLICSCEEGAETYYVYIINTSNQPSLETFAYTTDSANGYPSLED